MVVSRGLDDGEFDGLICMRSSRPCRVVFLDVELCHCTNCTFYRDLIEDRVEQKKTSTESMVARIDLRDRFAWLVMRDLMKGSAGVSSTNDDAVASRAYQVADAMLRARKAQS